MDLFQKFVPYQQLILQIKVNVTNFTLLDKSVYIK